MIKMYDVIVVGAGPGGSYASMKLSKNGFNVLLLEKEKLPRYKPCGGAIPDELVNELKLPEEFIERKFDHLNLYLEDNMIERNGKGVIVWRDKFDYYLTNEAISNGTILKDSCPFIDIKKLNGHYLIKTNQSDYKTKFVIAADGCNSTVLSCMGWPKFKSDDIALTVQYEMKMTPKNISDLLGEHIIHLFFGKNICKRGYGWIFPKKDIISVGWGSQLSLIKNASEEFDNFINYIKKFIINSKIIKKTAHLVPTTTRENIFKNNIFVIGDAAGFVDPLSGKGIVYSIFSGGIAASIITKHFNETDLEVLKEKYFKKLNREFLSVLKKKKLIQKDVYESNQSILRFLNLWKNHRSTQIALELWNKLT